MEGASIVKVGPVRIDDVDALRVATAGRTCPVVVFVDAPEVAEAVAPCVDKVTVGAAPGAIRLTDPDIDCSVTMAGNMIGIGSLYIGLAWGGIRQGRVWARNVFLISGAVTFLTLFYFLGTGFIEPLHTLVVLVLFPMFVLTIWRKPPTPRSRAMPEGPESDGAGRCVVSC